MTQEEVDPAYECSEEVEQICKQTTKYREETSFLQVLMFPFILTGMIAATVIAGPLFLLSKLFKWAVNDWKNGGTMHERSE